MSMDILDIFRKKKVAQEAERVRFSEVKEFMLNKRRALNEKEKLIAHAIKDRLNLLTSELESGINVLSNINLDQRKVEEKLKQISKTNLDRYLFLLNELKDDLKNLEFSTIHESNKVLFRIQKLERDSYMNFEKATILVGKEIEIVVQSIRSFLTDYKNILGENKGLTEDSSAIVRVESIIQEISDIEDNLRWHEGEKNRVLSDINFLKDKVKDQIEMEEQVLKSREHAEYLEKKTGLEKRKKELEHELNRPRSVINLKSLASLHHANEKNMAIITEYRANLARAIEKDNGESVLSIIEHNHPAKEQINKINNLRDEISNYGLIEDKARNIREDARKTRETISARENDVQKLDRKISQGAGKIRNLKDNFSKELKRINVELY